MSGQDYDGERVASERRKFLQAVGVSAAATGFAGTATGKQRGTYTAVCSGDQEIPPVDTNARATARFDFGNDGVDYTLTVANIEDVAAAHIHFAPAGENGPVIAPLYTGPITDGRTQGHLVDGHLEPSDLTGPLSDDSIARLQRAIEHGNAYVNVHTTANPAGEVRGQIGDRQPNNRGQRVRPGSGSVTFVHDTHVHGRFGDPDAAANVANYFGLMNEIEAENPRVLRVGNGDDLASSVLSAVFQGKHIADAFSIGGLRYDTYGNHEFDMGPTQLRKMVDRSQFTWLSANVRDSRTGDVFASEQGAQKYALDQVGEVTVGITGLTTEQTPNVSSPGEHAEFLDLATALREVVPQMRADGADLVLVLSHVASPVIEDVVARVDGVDAVVGDHIAERYEEPKIINDTLISLVGDGYEHLGELTIDVEKGEVVDFDFTLHSLAAEQPTPDPDVEQVMHSYLDKVNDRLDVVIGRSTVPLDAREETVRHKESNLGNFIADAIRNSVNGDVALMNGGGIRTDTLYPAGDITKKMVMNILPFPNTVMKLEVSGETLLAALENGVSSLDIGHGKFPQVSGMEYTFDPELPVGNRIKSVMIDGAPLDPDGAYTLATNNYVATGGDGYTMLSDETVLVDANEGALLSNLIIDVIQQQEVISPEEEGRITRVDTTSSTASLVNAFGDD